MRTLLVAGMIIWATSAFGQTPVYFKFENPPGRDPFTIKLTDPAEIAEARDLLKGGSSQKEHVMGRILKRKVPYNPQWNFHLDPNTISFFAFAIEVCDASTAYVEDHLDEACGPFLPGCFWCPWSSRLVEEVPGP